MGHNFWRDLVNWFNDHDVIVDFFNHILLMAKSYIYYCRNNSITRSLKACTAKIRTVFKLERIIPKTYKKLNIHHQKRGKDLNPE